MNKFNSAITKILNSFLGIVLCFVSLFVFYAPYEIRIIPKVDSILGAARPILAGIILIFFLLLYISGKDFFKNNLALFAAAAFMGLLIYLTDKYNGDMDSLLSTGGLYAIYLLLVFAVFLKANARKYLAVMFIFFALVNIANMYTAYKYAGVGMWEEYESYRNVYFTLVGNYNASLEYVMPMAITGAALAHVYDWWFEFINYIMMAAMLIMAFKIDSRNQILSYILVIAVMVIGDLIRLAPKAYKYFFRVFSAPVLMCLLIALFICIVIIGQPLLSKVGLDSLFSNRYWVWNGSKTLIAERPYLGYGLEGLYTFISRFNGNPASCHCLYLQILYCTGYVGAAVYLIFMAISSIAIVKAKVPGLRFLLGALLFITYMGFLVESFNFVYAIMTLGLVYYIARFANPKEKAAL